MDIELGGIGFKQIGQVNSGWFKRAFQEEEVREDVECCARDKAPGPDRFTLAFFEHYWSTVKSDVMQTIVEF